jgi:hypothetical protein
MRHRKPSGTCMTVSGAGEGWDTCVGTVPDVHLVVPPASATRVECMCTALRLTTGQRLLLLPLLSAGDASTDAVAVVVGTDVYG